MYYFTRSDMRHLSLFYIEDNFLLTNVRGAFFFFSFFFFLFSHFLINGWLQKQFIQASPLVTPFNGPVSLFACFNMPVDVNKLARLTTHSFKFDSNSISEWKIPLMTAKPHSLLALAPTCTPSNQSNRLIATRNQFFLFCVKKWLDFIGHFHLFVFLIWADI